MTGQGWLSRHLAVLLIIAVKGSNYCVSATRAVQLIVANAMRLATVNVVGDSLLFLGKLGVAAACGVVAFAMSNLAYYNDPANFPSTFLSSAILPIALAVLTGFIVAQVSTPGGGRPASPWEGEPWEDQQQD